MPKSVLCRRQEPGALRCSFCGREILRGDEYWACNGFHICINCLPDFARQELAPFYVRRGKE